MKINYNLTVQDYIHFNLFHTKNSKRGRLVLNLLKYLFPIILIFSSISNDNLIPFLVFSILWVIFSPKLLYSQVRKNVMKLFEEGKNDGILGEHTMILTEGGFVQSNSNGESKFNWPFIQEFKEDDEFIYLYNSAASAILIPKRDLQDQKETIDLIQSRVMGK